MSTNLSTAKFTSAARRIKALVGFVSEPNSKLFSAFVFCKNRRVPLLAELAESAERSFLAVSTAGSGFAAACRGYPAMCPCSKKAACSRHSALRNESEERPCDAIGAEKGFLPPRPRQSGARPPVHKAFAVPAVQSVNLTVDSSNENTPKLYFDTVFAAEFESRCLTFCKAEPSAK